MNREHLPNRRASETFNFEAQGGFRYVATVSRFADGRIGEIFLGNHKAGNAADVNARDAAVVCSLALQHGVPVETIRAALMRDGQGRASGPLGAALDILSRPSA